MSNCMVNWCLSAVSFLVAHTVVCSNCPSADKLLISGTQAFHLCAPRHLKKHTGKLWAGRRRWHFLQKCLSPRKPRTWFSGQWLWNLDKCMNGQGLWGRESLGRKNTADSVSQGGQYKERFYKTFLKTFKVITIRVFEMKNVPDNWFSFLDFVLILKTELGMVVWKRSKVIRSLRV